MRHISEPVRPPRARFTLLVTAVSAVAAIELATSFVGHAQMRKVRAPEGHLTIPYLVSTRPGDIEFAAAECDLREDGEQMACRFRQVFITQTAQNNSACAITTNGYEQSFQRYTPTRWVSTDAPSGACGAVEVTTLEDGGTTRWTMTIQKRTTNTANLVDCPVEPETLGVYSWRDVTRSLPCSTVQPGAIER